MSTPSTASFRRKPYARPRLVEHGDVDRVTKSLGVNGNKDGGAGSMQKTQA